MDRAVWEVVLVNDELLSERVDMPYDEQILYRGEWECVDYPLPNSN